MADLSDIPAEAVEAAARASFLRQTDFDHLSDPGKDAERFQARRMLAAALPVLDTAKDTETREAVAAELERRADEFVNQAKVFGNPHPSTPGAGVVSTLLDLSREFRTDAAALRGEQGPLFTCPGLAMPQPTGAPPEGYVACYRAGHECTSKTISTDDEHGGLSTRTFCPCCGDGHGYSYIPASLGGGQ